VAGFGLAVTVACATWAVTAGRVAAGVPVRTAEVLLWQGLVWGAWWLVLLLLIQARVDFRRPGRLLAGVYLLGLFVVPAHSGLSAALANLFSPAGRAMGLVGSFLERLPINLLTYTAVAGTALAVWAQRRASAHAALAADLRQALDQAHATASAPAAKGPERLLVSVGSRQVPVEPREVEWFGSAANYVVVNWAGREGLVRDTLTALERRLDPNVFARIHRSTIVNLSKVRDAQPLSDGSWRLVTESGAELVASRTYRDAVLGRLGRSTAS
jgi:hypothetical protein